MDLGKYSNKKNGITSILNDKDICMEIIYNIEKYKN